MCLGKSKTNTETSSKIRSERNLHTTEVPDNDDLDPSVAGNLWQLEENVDTVVVNHERHQDTTVQKEPPIFAEVTVQGVQVKMKLNTGVVFSVMDDTDFRSRFPGVVIEPFSIRLQGYFS